VWKISYNRFSLTVTQYIFVNISLLKFIQIGRKMWKIKDKAKVRPATDHEGPEEKQKCSCTLYLTSALDGAGV